MFIKASALQGSSRVKTFRRNSQGQSLMEMALIIMLIALVSMGALQVLGTYISQQITHYAANFNGDGGGGGGAAQSSPYQGNNYPTTPAQGEPFTPSST
jgi:Flp pilus assembly pilin Flp